MGPATTMGASTNCETPYRQRHVVQGRLSQKSGDKPPQGVLLPKHPPGSFDTPVLCQGADIDDAHQSPRHRRACDANPPNHRGRGYRHTEQAASAHHMLRHTWLWFNNSSVPWASRKHITRRPNGRIGQNSVFPTPGGGAFHAEGLPETT